MIDVDDSTLASLHEDLYDEEFKYYKFIDDTFSEEELEDGVLSEDEEYEIFEIWRDEINC